MVAVWIRRSTLVVVHDALEAVARPQRTPFEYPVNQLAEQYYAVWVPDRQLAGLLLARAVWFSGVHSLVELLATKSLSYSPMIIAPTVEEASMYYHLGVRIPMRMQHAPGMTPEATFAFEP